MPKFLLAKIFEIEGICMKKKTLNFCHWTGLHYKDAHRNAVE